MKKPELLLICTFVNIAIDKVLAQSGQCENLTESTVFLLLVALLGVLLVIIVALALLVLRLRTVNTNASLKRTKRPTIRQNNLNNTQDEVIQGGSLKSQVEPEVQRREPTPTKVNETKRITEDIYSEADAAPRDSTYAQPDHPAAVKDTPQAQSSPKQNMAEKMKMLDVPQITKNKYPYSKVNKSIKVKTENTTNTTSTASEEPDMTIIDGNVYSPLEEGTYDHLNKKRAKIEDDQKKPGNYHNISMSKEIKEKARTLDRKVFEAHYATPPPQRSMTLKAYPRTHAYHDQQETYDVPLKPTPLVRNKKFGGSFSSLGSSNRLITEETYDVPPSADDTYRIPPSSQPIMTQEETYDVPPSADDTYRIPPSSRPLTEEMYAVVPERDPDAEDEEPSAHSTLKKGEELYDKPPLIPSKFQDMYNVPTSSLKNKQKIVRGLVYEDV